jgi:hypothetical protein
MDKSRAQALQNSIALSLVAYNQAQFLTSTGRKEACKAGMQQLELFPVSEYTQRWRNRKHAWRHTSEDGFNPRLYTVEPILTDNEAKVFVEQHHYSGSYPAAKYRYGLYDKEGLVGVAVLSVPSRNEVLTSVFPDLLANSESVELGRLVILDHILANAESWMISRVFELASHEGVRGVVSFSDPVARVNSCGETVFPGHLGIIYQASNAVYLGRSTPRSCYLLPNGQVLHDRMLQKIRTGEQGYQYGEKALISLGASPRKASEDRVQWLSSALKEVGVHRMRHTGKHRYAFRLGRRRKDIRLGLPVFPYPKRLPVTSL